MKTLLAIAVIGLALNAAAETYPQATSMPQLEQIALFEGKGEMALPGDSPIRIKAYRKNFIAQTRCAYVAVSYLYDNPTADAPNRIGVFETVSPVCPTGQEVQAIELGAATKDQSKPAAPDTKTPPTLKKDQTEAFSAAWLRENLPRLMDKAIDDPTQENVAAYLYAQRALLELD